MTGIIAYAWLQLARRWRNLAALAFLALAATALFTATTTLRDSVDHAFAVRAGQSSTPEVWIRTSGPAEETATLASATAELGASTVLDVRPVLVGQETLQQLATVVIDSPDWSAGRPITLEGRAVGITGEVTVDHLLADLVGASIGDTLTLDAGTETVDLTVVGTFVHTVAERTPLDPGLLMVHADQLGSFPVMGNRWIAMEQTQFEQLIPSLQSDRFGPDITIDVDDDGEFAGSYLEAINPMTIVMTAIGGLAAVMVFILIATITAGQALARRRELGVVRALGWSTSDVRWLMAIEASIPALVGALAGIPVGLVIARWLAAESTAPLALDPALRAPGFMAFVAAVGVVVIGTLAALVGSNAAVRRSPAQLIRAGRGIDSTSASPAKLIDRLRAVPVVAAAAHYALRPRSRAALVLVSLTIAATLTSMVVHYDEVIDALEGRAGVATSEVLTIIADTDVDVAAATAGRADVIEVFLDDDDEVNYEDALAGTVAYGIAMASGGNPAGLSQELAASSGGAIRPVDTHGGDIATLRAIRSAVRPVTVVLLIIGLSALVVMIAQRLREQRRDVAVLGALGVTGTKRMVMTTAMAVIPGVVALAIGLPLGPLMLELFMRMADGSEFVDLIRSPGTGWMAGIAVGFLAVSALAAAPIGLRLARLRPAETLRHLD
jgi:ABC-type antimicrobial peptide transport system permease subunit